MRRNSPRKCEECGSKTNIEGEYIVCENCSWVGKKGKPKKIEESINIDEIYPTVDIDTSTWSSDTFDLWDHLFIIMIVVYTIVAFLRLYFGKEV